MPSETHQARLLQHLEEKPILRSRDLKTMGIPTMVLHRLVLRGEVQKLGRGLYASMSYEAPSTQSLLEVQMRVPQSTVCLLSALSFHELTTQAPFEVWIGIPSSAHLPRINYPPVRTVRFSAKAQKFEVETHLIQGIELRVTSPARTVAGCFKYRNTIGLDVALEALKDYWQEYPKGGPELWEAASFCRVKNIMKPYIEATIL